MGANTTSAPWRASDLATSGNRLSQEISTPTFPCLVSYTGRKSGKRLTTPLIHVPHEDGVLLVASQGGLDTHPLWYRNIQANPAIEVNEFGRVRRMIARTAEPAEKLRLWPVVRAVHPDFDEYQARTDRDIPLVVCTPST